MIGRCSAAQRRPMILRRLLRVENLQKLKRCLRDLTILRPIRQLGAFGLGKALAKFDGLRPLVWLFNDVEARRGQRVADRPQLYLHQEETEAAVGVLVEPLDRLPVLVARAGNNSDHNFGALAGSVRDDFAQMVMVRILELVFDDNLAPGSRLLRVDVDVERADG